MHNVSDDVFEKFQGKKVKITSKMKFFKFYKICFKFLHKVTGSYMFKSELNSFFEKNFVLRFEYVLQTVSCLKVIRVQFLALR